MMENDAGGRNGKQRPRQKSAPKTSGSVQRQ
jgi:hypothetical protein